jgi:hypothetical protein
VAWCYAVAALHVCATPINRAGQYTTMPDATKSQGTTISYAIWKTQGIDQATIETSS